MRITELHAERFRNLAPLALPIHGQFVVLHGPNAQGKTNALEVVHVLATLKPIRGHRNRDLVHFGDAQAQIGARTVHQRIERTLRVGIETQARKIWLDGKSTTDLGEYFSAIRAITFTPSEGEIVSGEPTRRRNWIDRAIFTQGPLHLERVRAVRRVLDQKSALLREDRPDLDLLDVLNQELARHGADLSDRRARMLAELLPHAVSLHRAIVSAPDRQSESEALDSLALSLRTEADGQTLEEKRETLSRRLREVRPRELARRMTLCGPQLDDVRIMIAGKLAKDFASRGQVRSVVLALKLAEMVAARQHDLVPVFLIDDVSSELDADRTRRLVTILGDLGAQVFATTTDPQPLYRALPREQTQGLRVDAGSLFPD